MAKRVQRRRGTTAEHATFTGYDGESTVDTTKDTVVVHDGTLAGGYPLAREDMSNVTNKVGITQLNLSDGTNGQVIKTNGSGTISFGTIDVTGSAVGGDISGTVGNAQIVANAVTATELANNSVGITQINVADGTNGQALITNGSGTLSFGDVLTDPALGGHLSGTTSAAVINANTITTGMLTTALKNFTVDEFVGASAQTTFTLTAAVGSVNALLVYIDGIVQPTSAYSLPTSTSIQFTVAPPVSAIIRCLHLGFQSTVGVPSDGTITTAKIAANAVTSAKILNGTIATADLADDLITEAKIFAQTITNASITPGTIRSQEIENATITGTDIANNTIDGTKIALGGDTQGDIIYYDGTNWVRLAAGTSGYHLQTGGAGANPSWTGALGAVGSGAVVKTTIVSKVDMFTPGGNYGTYQDITGLSGAVTPSVTTSKVFLTGHVLLAINSRTMLIRIMRSIAGGTYAEVGSGTAAGSRSRSHSSVQQSGGSSGPNPATIHFVDTPTFTLGQAITYKIQARDMTGTGQWWCNAPLNDTDNDDHTRTTSGFTIQELL